MDPEIRLLGYARVSTGDQAASGYGLDAQEAAIREGCTQRGWVLAELLRDEGESGKSLDRPALRQALEGIASGAASGLVVAKLDRLSRSVADFAALLSWFTEADATLVALDIGVDTSTPGGRLVANVFASVAEWEREIIAARTRDGLRAARAAGRPISRRALVDDPRLAKRVKVMRSRGMTFQAIAERLNREGVPTLRGGAEWRPSSVQTALGGKRRPRRRQVVDLPPTSSPRQAVSRVSNAKQTLR
jgi:DNA invertase Pin-like site-specific DNA recombinase